MFKTIVNQARRTPAKGEERISTVRCLQIPNHFDDNIILRQLRYTGMLETVRIRRAGYSVRIEWDALVRGVLARNHLRRQAYAALVIQSNWKRYREEHRYRLLREAVIALQSAFRGREARKRFAFYKAVKLPVFDLDNPQSLAVFGLSDDDDLERLGDIPRQRGRIRVKRVQAVKLPVFDLDNPQSLAVFGLSDDDDLESDEDDGESTQDGLDEDVSESSVLGDIDDEAIELDATFILEDTKLKLIEDSCDLASHRRQSLAPTASTAKLKMLRRANSTDSNTMVRPDDNFKPLQLGSPTAKKKTGSRMGFTKAKKNLKALFGRRSGSINEDDGVDMELPPRVQAMLPQGVFLFRKVSSLHSFVADEIADEVQLTATSMGHREQTATVYGE
ncbi:hypothetical protein TELCIR_17399 [Teladorsagia circumcincta]|uniref:Myosin motor domain-containing protein n=1 Tax=Teladorsagia circumcincta TaxID=45464 RepID=A0A2G9TT54_TELCI|nr:hypothetical protein TELCIR_17399 [Teladorsagia circumcincta]